MGVSDPLKKIAEKIAGKPKEVKKDDIIIKEVDLGKTIKLPNGEVIEKSDIIQITPEGTVIYISSDGSIKTARLVEHARKIEDNLNISLV